MDIIILKYTKMKEITDDQLVYYIIKLFCLFVYFILIENWGMKICPQMVWL